MNFCFPLQTSLSGFLWLSFQQKWGIPWCSGLKNVLANQNKQLDFAKTCLKVPLSTMDSIIRPGLSTFLTAYMQKNYVHKRKPADRFILRDWKPTNFILGHMFGSHLLVCEYDIFIFFPGQRYFIFKNLIWMKRLGTK